jgi:glycosyltransferase involved in cell wall biosynthesis
MPTSQPLLSIVTATRGNFSAQWFQRLCQIQGDVEFVLVYPPGVEPQIFTDRRIKVVHSPYWGEVIQRGLGLLNALGKYVIALDDDDFLHPDVTAIIPAYFARCPESWALRLCVASIDHDQSTRILGDWQPLPQVSELTLVPRQTREHNPETILQSVPIAPLNNRFQWRSLWVNTRRCDHHGAHIENFNNIVWRTEYVKPALVELFAHTRVHGPSLWLPFWNLDRLLGLFIQAHLFQADRTIGHWLRGAEQVRKIERPHLIKEIRTMFPADLLLALKFPQYGYFWNLFFEQFWIALKVIVSYKLGRIPDPEQVTAMAMPIEATVQTAAVERSGQMAVESVDG